MNYNNGEPNSNYISGFVHQAKAYKDVEVIGINSPDFVFGGSSRSWNTRESFEYFMEIILNDLKSKLPVDGVYLALHGAMAVREIPRPEAGSGTDAAAMSCKAKLSEDGRHYILNGEKMWVTNGASADIYVLFAKDVDHPDFGVKKHGGTTAFIVDSTMEGFSVGKKEDKLGMRYCLQIRVLNYWLLGLIWFLG